MATSTSTRGTGADLPARRPRHRLPVRSGLGSSTRSPAQELVGLVCVALCCGVLACSAPRGTIGAILGQQNDGRVFLREVPPGLAAERAGLQEGDEILLIEGRDVRVMTEQDLHRALGGQVGDPVRLTFVRGDDVIRVTLERTAAPGS